MPEFTCTNCGKCYKHRGSLKRHMDFECGQEPKFVCPVCPKRWRQKNDLNIHARVQHGLELSIRK